MMFHSDEWYEKVKERSRHDRLWKANSKGFTCRWQNLQLDCPNGIDRLIEWEVRNAEVVLVNKQEKKAPSYFRTLPLDTRKYLARFVGDYWVTYVKLHTGEVTVMVAIGKGDYDIQGNITEVMKKIEAFDAFVDMTRECKAEYE